MPRKRIRSRRFGNTEWNPQISRLIEGRSGAEAALRLAQNARVAPDSRTCKNILSSLSELARVKEDMVNWSVRRDPEERGTPNDKIFAVQLARAFDTYDVVRAWWLKNCPKR